MTGPEHYKRAEALLAGLNTIIGNDAAPAATVEQAEQRSAWANNTVAQAQVHATLALAAATAVVADDESEWREAVIPDGQ